jgi:hypothetical protein
VFCELQETSEMRVAQELIGVGVLASIGISIVMSVTVSQNTTGWGAGIVNMSQNIIPLVLAAGFVLAIIGLALMVRGHGKGV